MPRRGRSGKRAVKKPGSIRALRESEARFRSLAHLSSDWFWEQDAHYRFTRIEGRNASSYAPSLLGRARWETGLDVEGGWAQHREALEARRPFIDTLMWRTEPNGKVRYMVISGEPFFASDGRFLGYRGVGRDVTAQKRAEQLLRLEHQVARALSEAQSAHAGVEAVLHAVCETEGWACGRFFALDDAGGEARYHVGWCSDDPVFERFLAASGPLAFRPGYGLVGKVLQTGDPLWCPDTASDPRVQARELAGAGPHGAFQFAATAEGRRVGVLSFSSRVVREPDHRLLQAASIVGSQVGQFLQRMRAEAALRESEERFRSLTQMSSDFFWETDAQHRFTQLAHGNRFAEQFASVILGKTAWDIPSTAPDEQAWARMRATMDAHEPFRDFEFGRPGAGGARHFSVTGEPRFDASGRFLGYRGVGRDITDLVLARERIATLAFSDPLTGLANRTSLAPAFERAVERARRRGTRIAAVFIDLDGFKQVNDARGHEAGDLVLSEVARRLRSGLRASDLVARIGGDEFFAVLEDVQGPEQADAIARKLLAEIARPIEARATACSVTASIGIALFPDHAADAATLMKRADAAMYEAKQAGKNSLAFAT
jgi:diguanylate cyclase (GGDEF)-like protein/PAS domain S-box-containing protein